MSYYFSKSTSLPFEQAIERVSQLLADSGFGILTEIDVAATMKKKLDEEFPPYRILGACNPHFALKALTAENKIGTMLPCNVIVREQSDGRIEVAAVDPIASMQAVANPALAQIASQVQSQLKAVIEAV
ncbi:MAG: hypothetical protein DHS20C11_14550 [Lysobacteraceae bacterium]|nr:MAG: hypothetical protein DHS20C11_14550 [Xanthomonadaceae bacterium]